MKKLLSTTLAAGIFASMSMSPVFAITSTTLPSLSSATNATVTTSNADMNIQISEGKGTVGTLNWNSYNIGSDASVNYEFTGYNQVALNKVAASGGLSEIYGKITSSSCSSCGYDYGTTGHVILLNPNGVAFYNGSSVNLNSFTVSTYDGEYDSENRKLVLTRTSETDPDGNGIQVFGGATIYGDKGVTFAADNITLYQDSLIKTNTAINDATSVDEGSGTAYGKVKLVTADGVTFNYYNNGAVKSISDVTTSSDKMVIALEGTIESGQIDARNYSTNSDSDINVNHATLKATKAVKGNDGNIWLTSYNHITIEDSTFTTVNADGAEDVSGGNIHFSAKNKISAATSDFDAAGDISMSSTTYDVVVSDSTLDTENDVTISAYGIASVQDGSEINADNITIAGQTGRGQAVSSTLNAGSTINITSDDSNAWASSSTLTAGDTINITSGSGKAYAYKSTLSANDINITSDSDSVVVYNSTLNADNKITLKAAEDVTASNTDLADSKTYVYAGNDITLDITNAGNADKGLVAEAGNDMTITTDGTLAVSKLIAGNDMTLTADKVIKGADLIGDEGSGYYFDEAGDSDSRGYIQVGGTFTSTDTDGNVNYTVDASTDLTEDGAYNQKHWISTDGESDNILLVTNLAYTPAEQEEDTTVEDTPVETPVVTEVEEETTTTMSAVSINDTLLHKLTRQPESYSNTTNVSDGRTTVVDVFAAASQIEIEDDEEEK